MQTMTLCVMCAFFFTGLIAHRKSRADWIRAMSMSMSVCSSHRLLLSARLYVCLHAYLRNYIVPSLGLPTVFCTMLPTTVSRSCSGGVAMCSFGFVGDANATLAPLHTTDQIIIYNLLCKSHSSKLTYKYTLNCIPQIPEQMTRDYLV